MVYGLRFMVSDVELRVEGSGFTKTSNWARARGALRRNVKRFRGGLVIDAHRLFVSLNSRLESNKEEEEELDGFIIAKRKPLQRFEGLLPESQGQNLVLTVLYVPHSGSGFKKTGTL